MQALIVMPVVIFLQQASLRDMAMESIAKAESIAFFKTNDYQTMVSLVNKWKSNNSKTKRIVLLQAIKSLKSTELIGLTNYSDNFISKRVVAGEMTFAGHGVLIEHDLYVECFRSAWAIQNVTGVKILPIKDHYSDKELALFIQECDKIANKFILEK